MPNHNSRNRSPKKRDYNDSFRRTKAVLTRLLKESVAQAVAHFAVHATAETIGGIYNHFRRRSDSRAKSERRRKKWSMHCAIKHSDSADCETCIRDSENPALCAKYLSNYTGAKEDIPKQTDYIERKKFFQIISDTAKRDASLEEYISHATNPRHRFSNRHAFAKAFVQTAKANGSTLDQRLLGSMALDIWG